MRSTGGTGWRKWHLFFLEVNRGMGKDFQGLGRACGTHPGVFGVSSFCFSMAAPVRVRNGNEVFWLFSFSPMTYVV